MPASNRFRHHRSALALAVCAVLWPLSVCASPTGNINLDAINAAGAYAQGFTGAGVRIGILDSGFDTTHIAFEGKDIIKLYSDQYLEKFGTGVNATQQSHGSHVAGIASGNSSVNYGVAKDASLLLLYSTIQGPTMIYEVADLYKKAIETYDDVKIYSNSWGWVRGMFSYGDIPNETCAFKEVFNSAVEHDKLMVFAAGNQGGLAPADPILPIMRDPTKAGHFINVVNIESDHLFEEGHFIHGNSGVIEASNQGLFASLWTIAAPGTNIVSAEAGSGNGSIEMTGTSMAAPHVAGTLALVQQAFPWMTASQLADTVLSTAQKPQERQYDVIAIHPDSAQTDPSHKNPDYHLQFGGRLNFSVASPGYSVESGKYETNVYKESAAIVFWGSAGDAKKADIDALKEEAATRAAGDWLEQALEEADWDMDPEAYRQAVYDAYEEWKTYFKEHCIIVEYAIGAGLLDAASAVGGIAELNINRMARWDETNSKWTLPVQTGLNGQNQIAYTLNLAGNGVSRFINDINEVRWNPTLHITTQEELKAYNESIQSGQPYKGSSNQTSAPDQADLPVSLVVSGTLDKNNNLVSAGTLVMSGHASHSGSTDVINGATLVVDGIIDNDVQSDATATVAGRGVVGSLTSRGTLSPGDDLSPGNRIGTFHVQGQLKLEAGSSLVLDVGEHTIDQIIVGNLSQDQTSSLTLLAKSGQESNAEAPLNITIRTGQYVDQTITLHPSLFFPGLGTDDEIFKQVTDAKLSWGGGITFEFVTNQDGSFEMHRVENSMQLVGKTVSLSQDAMRRAQKLDAVIQADGILSGTAAEFVSAVDILSENLREGHPESDKQLVATTLENAFASTKADSHLAFDAAAMSRSIRLREVTALSPLIDLYATDVIPEASLVVERANMDGAKSFQSTRTILSAGARRSFGDWALGWKVGGYYDDIEISGPDKGNAQGVFASVSAMREFGAGMRLFGQALLGYGVEDRTRYVSDFDVSKRLNTTTHAVSLGASIGIGRKFAPDQIALSFMPYAQLSWDGIHRDDVRESDSLVAQEYEDELLSVAALEAGLAFKTRSSAASPTGNFFLEGRIAYRNRFHVNGDEAYTWTGIRDETNVEFFDNRHAAAAQCKIGWVSSTGHEFALMLDGEAGDSGDERWGASLRWTKHF